MIGIGDFFKRIQGVYAKEIQVRTSIQAAIKKLTGADIPIESISVSSSTVVLKNATSSLKSAIYIKKNAIIEEINKGQEIKKISDIR